MYIYKLWTGDLDSLMGFKKNGRVGALRKVKETFPSLSYRVVQ
jgi:hypothetical protein